MRILITSEEVEGVFLQARSSFWNEPKEILDAITNGCGPAGLGDFLVPDTFYGLNVRPVCQIHDYDYHRGKNREEKDAGDDRFLENLNAWIDAKTTTVWGVGHTLRRLRKNRAHVYYLAVHLGGDSSFGESKLKEKEVCKSYSDSLR
jgi:hypothetical protein